MRADFGVARVVIQILEIVGWLTVIAGLILAAQAMGSERNTVYNIVIMLGVSVAGLFQVAAAQITKAVVATAESTAELVEIARRGGAGDRTRPPTPGATRQSGPPTPMATSSARGVGGRVKVYKGKEILREAKGVSVDGQVFENVIQAEKYISGLT